MGLNFLDLLRYSRRQREAAKQMWGYVRQGVSFEIPVSLSTDDDTVRALQLLCKQHPEVSMGEKAANGTKGSPLVLQSRGIVVGLRKSMKIGPQAAQVLDSNGYTPEMTGDLESLLAAHEGFIRAHGGLEPEEAVKQAQQESRDRNAIVVPEQAEERAQVDADVPPPKLAAVADPVADAILTKRMVSLIDEAVEVLHGDQSSHSHNDDSADSSSSD